MQEWQPSLSPWYGTEMRAEPCPRCGAARSPCHVGLRNPSWTPWLLLCILMLVQLNIPRPSTHVWMFGIFIRTKRDQEVLALRFPWFRFDPSFQAVRLPLSDAGSNRTRTQQHPIAFVRWTPRCPSSAGQSRSNQIDRSSYASKSDPRPRPARTDSGPSLPSG